MQHAKPFKQKEVEVSVCAADEALVAVDVQHPPLSVTASVAGRGARTPQPSHPSPVIDQWNFNKADYQSLYSSIASANWNSLYELKEPEDALNYFYDSLDNIFNCCVPKKRGRKVNSRYSYPDWYTIDIIRGIERKARLHKKYKSTGAREDYQAFSECRAKIKTSIKDALEHHQKQVQRNLARDPKSFWNYIRLKRGTSQRKKITRDGITLSEEDCAEEFAKYFHSVYGSKPAKLNVSAAEAASRASANRVHIPHLSLNAVTQALAKLKPKRSAGPDGFPVFVFKDCRMALTKPLGHIYNLCLQASYFPQRWKVTRVIPIPKGEAGSEVSGFRPVAILSTPAKVFESALQRSLQEQVAAQLSDAQHGFRPARSTTSNLLNAMTYVIPQVDAGVQVDVAYFDFKKAFDLVDNDILLTKLATVGCTTKLLQFFVSYMSDRQQYVEYAGCKSQPYFTRTGVSQGSNLGPLEFIIMINDLPDVVKEARCLLFADDLKLLLSIQDERDSERLQQDVDRVAEWSRRNKLKFNVDKCSVLTFSRAKTPYHYNYSLDGSLLKRRNTVRDLGVLMDTDLRFRVHAVSVCKKAFRCLGFVLRQAHAFTSMKAVTALYGALVRSQLECSVAVWAPHETKYSLMMERIQNKFARYLYWKQYGVYPFYPLMYPTLFVLGMVGYNKLETRRDLALSLYVIKVFRGIITDPGILRCMSLCVPDAFVHRRRRPLLFSVPRGRTHLVGKAPLTRTLHTLNLVAEILDVFHVTLNEFAKATLFVICK